MMDYILKGLSQDFGAQYGGVTVNALAYADDVVLMASSRQGMNQLLNKFVESGFPRFDFGDTLSV